MTLTKTESGLIVPEDAITKQREVWTKDESRLMRRVINLLLQRKIRCIMVCQECQKGEQLQQEAVVVPSAVDAAGTLVWSCGHKDREMGSV